MKDIIIAVDAMGGDHGPSVIVPAALQVLAQHPNLQLVLVGDQTILQSVLSTHSSSSALSSRIQLHHASEQVGMNEPPAQALRSKKDSSMRVAINLVKEGRAQACVSAGNTGALMATARFVLKTLPGIDRPAIISAFPTKNKNKNIRMLDLGANVDSTVDNLFQFAVMASVLVSAVDAIPHPKVCLLNIGEEDIKGNELVKQAAQVFMQSKAIHYAGYIEGDGLYAGDADIVVCDGFVGNIALKTTEGVALLVGQLVKEAFYRNIMTQLVGLLASPILKSVRQRMDPARYNGASLIGLRSTVIKSHGSAGIIAFARAIEQAIIEVEKRIPERISTEVENILTSSSRN